jgi:glycerophosphoryl diester phosphodiesterase
LRHPENTLPAYRAAFDDNADFIEVDVRTTSDGKLVIMHDETVDRCTDGHGEVASMTLDDIRSLDAGVKFGPAFRSTHVPTFEEVLKFARGKLGVYIDAKRVAAADLVAAVRRSGLEDQVVVYGRMQLLRDVMKLEPRLNVMPEARDLETVARILEDLRPRVIAFDERDFQNPIIALARRSKTDIYVDRLGSADNPESWEDAVRRGATGIQTDRPAEVVQFLRSKKLHR